VSVRRGFAILGVLWILVGAAAVALALTLSARDSAAAAFNRRALITAEWMAEDCYARAHLALDAVTSRTGRGGRGPAPFDSVPLLVEGAPIVSACPGVVRVSPVGGRLDLNALTGEMMSLALDAQGVAVGTRDSMVDAFLDWRDKDDVPRDRGCEADCALGRSAALPRDGPFAAVAELALVRGFDEWESVPHATSPLPLDSLFTVWPGRVHVRTAPLEVLAAIPGIGLAGAREIVGAGEGQHSELQDLSQLGSLLGPLRGDSLRLRFAELSAIATAVPDAWVLEVTARSTGSAATSPTLTVQLEARFAITGSGVRVLSRRVLP
jgi:type II secretory pathway component PulK